MLMLRRIIGILALLFGLGAMEITHAQEIVIVTVKSFGQGMTEAAAVKDAVVEAVGRVSGERISSRSVAQTKSEESTSGKSEHSASFEQRIDSLIRGVVKSSRTLSVNRDPVAGVFKAEVEVGVATYRQSEQLKRVKLAVVMGSQGLPRALGDQTASFIQALLNGASDKMVGSRKFAVLDRQQRDAAQREFSRITSGGAAVENYVRMQSAAIADFLIVVDVSEYVPGKSMLGSDRAKASARAIVYDYTSGQIRQAVNATSMRLMRDGSAVSLATQLGADLAEQIIDNAFPPQVIAIEAGNPIINSGFGQFEVGDAVDLFRQGKALRDPYTKETLGSAEVLVAQAQVETVMPKTSVLRLLGGERIADLKGNTFVVRRRQSEPVPATPRAQADPSVSVQKGKRNDDW
jgi:hypothetical protein